MATLSINGTRKSGQEVRDDNTTAVVAMSNIVKNSLGPSGLDKMIVDEVGELNITNDGATILKLIEVQHPAARILVELAKLQDSEIGDGTTSVVLMAAELVRRGNELAKSSIHPTTVISGYQQAKKAACKFLAENLSYKVDDLGEESLLSAAKTAMSSKVIGQEEAHFAKIAVAAMKSVERRCKRLTKRGRTNSVSYEVKDVGVLKIRGGSLLDSRLIDGVAISRSRSLSSFEMPSSVQKAKIAFIDFDLRREKLPFNVKIVCDDPAQLDAIRAEEVLAIERRVALLLDAGANVVFCSQAIDEFAMDAIARRGAIALKSVPRAQLKRVAKATGGRLLTSLAAMDAKDCVERVDASALGVAAEVAEEQIGDMGHLVVVRSEDSKGPRTILICGPNDYALDEVERSLHDVLCALKRVMESRHVVVGGGAAEAALSVYLEHFAETIGSREQLAVAEYAAALMIIPKTLAVNGSFPSMRLLSKLRAAHGTVIRDGERKLRDVGLNLSKGVLRDNLKAGVLEPAMGKVKALKFATEAAIAVLRIDDAVVDAPKQPPQGRRR